MFRLVLHSICFSFVLPVTAAPALREAPNATATPANQLVLAGNACGPTALLNAFRFGNPSWQNVLVQLPGPTDRERVSAIIRSYGMRPSANLKGRPRWSRKGVNLADLADMANEMTRGQYLPFVNQEILFLKPKETPEKLLRRSHDRLATSMGKGLPPILSLRRYAKRGETWVVLDAHFVTLKSLPTKLDKNATSFPITYIDPWGGKIAGGSITIPTNGVLTAADGVSPCLEAILPQAAVGKKLVRAGEPTSLVVAAALGRW